MRGLVRAGADRLTASGIEHARHEAEWLLSRLVGAKPLELYLEDPVLPEPTVARFFDQIDERAAGLPLQYLLGDAEFYGRPFAVAPGVFIPRPETEQVVEAALEALRTRARTLTRPPRVLDLGTGSGCIAVTVAKELSACVVVGVELSWEALQIARMNVRRHDAADRVRLMQGSWAHAVQGQWDGIISNPPYVPSDHVECLPLDVRQEPRLSLDGGPDGLRDLLTVMEQAERLLVPGGILACECAEAQVAELVRSARALTWVERVEPLNDLARRPRGLLCAAGRNGHLAH